MLPQMILTTSCRLEQGHTGEYLAKKLVECLKQFGIEKKILGITADNASNNDTLVANLEGLGGANSVRTHIRCFAHIWNLVVKVRPLVSPITASR